MMLSSKRLRFGCALAAALLLAGCDTFESIGDTVGDWFTSSNKSKLKGERIPLNALDEALRPDPALPSYALGAAAALSQSPNGRSRAAFASNAMYHLEAPRAFAPILGGRCRQGLGCQFRLTASPVIGGGRIFTLDSEAHVYAFDANSGQEIWDKRLAPKNGTDMPTLWGLLGQAQHHRTAAAAWAAASPMTTARSSSPPASACLICMDAGTGREIWRHDMGVPIVNAPVVNGGRIFVSTHDNHFYALAETDGRILWDQQGMAESAGILASTSAAVSGEFVIAPYTSGELYAMRVQNGQLAWNDVLSHSGHGHRAVRAGRHRRRGR